MVETQVATVESQRLADAFGQEIQVKAELIAASEGQIELTAHRESSGFERIVVNTSTSSARRQPRFTAAQIRRLAMDVRAAILAHSFSISDSARKVTVTIHARHAGFSIDVVVSYRASDR